jgi:hypothetical protein
MKRYLRNLINLLPTYLDIMNGILTMEDIGWENLSLVGQEIDIGRDNFIHINKIPNGIL